MQWLSGGGLHVSSDIKLPELWDWIVPQMLGSLPEILWEWPFKIVLAADFRGATMTLTVSNTAALTTAHHLVKYSTLLGMLVSVTMRPIYHVLAERSIWRRQKGNSSCVRG